MTLGQIRAQIRLLEIAQGVNLDKLDGFIQGRYSRILDRLAWRRLETESIIQVPPSYSTGTVAATQGSNAITGTGTAWTADMSGRIVRLNTSNDSTASSGEEYYQFTYESPTSATLDRNYENVDVTAAGYRIDQNFFLLPSNLRILTAIRPLHDRLKPLEIIAPVELSNISTQRTQYGSPRYAAFSWDSLSDPPTPQVELYPIPSSPNSAGIQLSFGVEYTYDPDSVDGSDTSVSLLPWARPMAIVNGVAQDLAIDKGDQVRAQMYGSLYTDNLAEMMLINASSKASGRLRMSPQYLGNRHTRYRHGPKHEGFTG